LSRSLVALDQDSTIIAVVELSQSSWLVAGVLPALSVNRKRSWNRVRKGFLACCDKGGALTVLWHEDAPNGELPSDPQQTDRHRPDTEVCEKPRLAVHHRSACSGVKALRNTSPLGGKPPSVATVSVP
jgi:hypothetical protein